MVLRTNVDKQRDREKHSVMSSHKIVRLCGKLKSISLSKRISLVKLKKGKTRGDLEHLSQDLPFLKQKARVKLSNIVVSKVETTIFTSYNSSQILDQQ